MHFGFRWAFAVVIGLLVAAPEARAQYYGGYGGYGGWGGWGGGSTVQGDFARGAGYYAMGAGTYNLDTAQANSINADTLMRWNEYMFQSQQLANKREYMRRARLMQRDAKAGEALYSRVRDNPTAADITNGDALNAILDQLTDPKVHSTALRLIKNPVGGQMVRQIPFENASEAVTLSLDDLTGEGDWPVALRGDLFAAERDAYRDAVTRAVKEDEAGTLSSQTLQDIDAAAARLRAKLESNKPADKVQYIDGVNYIKTLVAMSRMLQRPAMDRILKELDSVKETSLGSLLAFMHAYNLRFGPAKTPSQSAAYESLYPVMADARDRTLKGVGAGNTANTPVARSDRHPVDFFQNLHLEHLENGSSNNAPARP